jgi:NHLM bacteriocin system ABC transporter ATP-binding protein
MTTQVIKTALQPAPDTFMVLVYVSRWRLEEGNTVLVLPQNPEISIGRSKDNMLRLQDGLVSRHHAQISTLNNRILVQDLGSQNGTLVNGRKITQPVGLRPGDVVRFGEFEFVLQQATEEALRKGPPVATLAQPVEMRISLEETGVVAAAPVAPPSGPLMPVEVIPEEPPELYTGTFEEVTNRLGKVISVAGNAPFLLDDPKSVYILLDGKIELFMVQVKSGQPDETRHHIATLDSGEICLGMDLVRYGEGMGLLAVPQGNTRVVKFSQGRLRKMAGMPDFQVKIVELLEKWLEHLSGNITGSMLAPRTDVQLSPGENASVGAKLKAGALKGHLWVRFSKDAALFVGEEDFPRAHEKVPFPLYSNTWLTAKKPFEVRAETLDNILHEPETWEGLSLFYQMFFLVKSTNIRLSAFDEINRLRKKAEFDTELKQKTLDYLSAVVVSKPETGDLSSSGTPDPLMEACKLVGKAQGINIRESTDTPRNQRNRNYPVELYQIARASRVRMREVKLDPKWWKHDNGPLIGILEEKQHPVALLPASSSSYEMVDPADGSRTKITEAIAGQLDGFGYVFYRSFAEKPIKAGDMLKFGLHGVGSDIWVILLMAGIAGVLGLFTPILTGSIIDAFIPTGQSSLVLQIGVVLAVVALTAAALTITRSIAVLRLETRLDYSIQAALWDRLISLPVPFFRQYSVGDLSNRALGIEMIRNLISSSVATSILNSIFSLFSLILLFFYDVGLALIAVVLTIVTLAVILGLSFWQLRYQRAQIEQQGKVSGTVLQLISGIAKLRVAGAEIRAFASWARLFGVQRRLAFRARMASNYQLVFNAAWPVVTLIVLFGSFDYITKSQMTAGSFLAFLTAFAQFFIGMIGLAVAFISINAAVPIYERSKPILDALPEVDAGKTNPGELTGDIEISHVNFRYSQDGPIVLNDVSLKIKQGQMVAVVGPSGSGKSTLLRLLLGFDKPESGSIYYDNQDLAGLDVQAVRRQLGVVIQNGKLMNGDIFSNIVGSLPYSVDQAWEAARMSGIEQDIKEMPMGMYTLVSEGGGNLSGGQRQRIMIARAIISKPRILLFDEATSALDNQTQAIVSRSLESLQATRIVIAHRLSTIVNADCIYVMSGGKVVQSGTFHQLLNEPGLFRELARRQMV